MVNYQITNFGNYQISFYCHNGSDNVASHPLRSFLFASCRVPPWASAIWRLRIKPMPLPPVLVVKKGTKMLSPLSMPGPSYQTQTSTTWGPTLQPTETAPGDFS